MKKLIGYPTTWLLYYLGHYMCQLDNMLYGKLNFIYRAYQWCHTTSCDIQDWASLDKPWHNTKINK